MYYKFIHEYLPKFKKKNFWARHFRQSFGISGNTRSLMEVRISGNGWRFRHLSKHWLKPLFFHCISCWKQRSPLCASFSDSSYLKNSDMEMGWISVFRQRGEERLSYFPFFPPSRKGTFWDTQEKIFGKLPFTSVVVDRWSDGGVHKRLKKQEEDFFWADGQKFSQIS